MLETLPSQYLYIWLSLSNTESEANLNNNLMMRRAGLYMETIQVNFTLTWLILSCQLLRVFLSEPNVSLVEDDTLVSCVRPPGTQGVFTSFGLDLLVGARPRALKTINGRGTQLVK